MKNRVLPMLLCVVLVFTMMAAPNNPVQPPAHAVVTELTIGGVAVVLTILAACGITFATTDIGKKCVQQFAIDVPDVPEIAAELLGSTATGQVLIITAATLPRVKHLISEAIDYFKGKISVRVADSSSLMMQNVKVYPLSTFSKQSGESDSAYASRLWSIAPYSFDDNITFNHVKRRSYDKYSDSFCFCLQDIPSSPNGGSNHTFHLKSVDVSGSSVSSSYVYSNYYFTPSTTSYRYGFYSDDFSLAAYGYYTVTAFLCSCYNGQYSVCSISDAPLNTYVFQLYPASSTVTNGYNDCGVDTINIGNIDDINEAIRRHVGEAADGIQADIQDVIDAVNAGTAADTVASADAARELLGIEDYLKALEAAQERTIDAIKEGTKEDDMNIPQLPATITDKFPFCVPFDLIALVKTFSAEPEAPKVTVPVVFQSMNYSHDFTFDFSSNNWDKLAAVIRWGTLIIFMLGLTLITRKLIKG